MVTSSNPVSPADAARSFDSMWEELRGVGADPRGGYARFAWTTADLTLREWFTGQAQVRGMAVETDRNGNIWAWWGEPGPDAFVTGSHLDSVPGGGAYDGPLGVVSSFAAVDALRTTGITPSKPVAVVCFSDEEGARFGIACVGSRLMSGALDPDRGRALTDVDGTTMAEAMVSAGRDPLHIGRDDESLSRIGVFVELHVEQGRGLVDLGAPVGVASAIWPHGRWRLTFRGEGNHAGTTRLEDRHDPMLTLAETVLSARKRARLAGALTTIGRVEVEPNGTNAIPSEVRAWMDARAADQSTLDQVVAEIEKRAHERAGRDGVALEISQESVTGRVDFPAQLRDRLAETVASALGEAVPAVPVLPTGAGHDAGILAAVVPTAMLFVRNPTGVSHSPAEHAERDDCVTGVRALAAAMADYVAPGDPSE